MEFKCFMLVCSKFRSFVLVILTSLQPSLKVRDVAQQQRLGMLCQAPSSVPAQGPGGVI